MIAIIDILFFSGVLLAIFWAAQKSAFLVGDLANRRRHPNDAELFDVAMQEISRSPDRFKVTEGSRIEVSDGVFNMDSHGSLSVYGSRVITSIRQERKIKNQVRRLCKNRNRKPLQEVVFDQETE